MRPRTAYPAPEHRDEDLLVADLAEPQPVGVEADQGRACEKEAAKNGKGDETRWSL